MARHTHTKWQYVELKAKSTKKKKKRNKHTHTNIYIKQQRYVAGNSEIVLEIILLSHSRPRIKIVK